jgi:hypothetical protein
MSSVKGWTHGYADPEVKSPPPCVKFNGARKGVRKR